MDEACPDVVRLAPVRSPLLAEGRSSSDDAARAQELEAVLSGKSEEACRAMERHAKRIAGTLTSKVRDLQADGEDKRMTQRDSCPALAVASDPRNRFPGQAATSRMRCGFRRALILAFTVPPLIGL